MSWEAGRDGGGLGQWRGDGTFQAFIPPLGSHEAFHVAGPHQVPALERSLGWLHGVWASQERSLQEGIYTGD